MEDQRVSISLDGVVEMLKTALELALSFFKPMMAGLSEILGDGPIGLLVVFTIFFSIFLARTAARTRNAHDFGVAIAGVGAVGLRVSVLYGLLLFVEWALLPLLVCGFILLVQTAFGMEPGLMGLPSLLDNTTDTGRRFVGDILLIYADPDRYVLPIGWRATTLILACFACMLLVGRILVGAAQSPRPNST